MHYDMLVIERVNTEYSIKNGRKYTNGCRHNRTQSRNITVNKLVIAVIWEKTLYIRLI